MTDAEVISSWHRLKKYGALLMPGGQIDQPPEWWDDIDTCEALYNTLLEQAYAEKDRQQDSH